jgi:hypothetical protein
MDPKKARDALCRAAVEGLLSGLSLVACAPARGASVTAPMDPPGAVVASPSAERPPPLAVPVGTVVAAEPAPKDCCRGRNECKGLGGCASALNECKGKNACKGTATSCEEGDDAPRPPAARTGSCCAGKNDCKGKSACRTARNRSGPGLNECKGKGTNCPRRRP